MTYSEPTIGKDNLEKLVGDMRRTITDLQNGTDTGWKTGTLINGWLNFDATNWGVARYRRVNGIVYVRGLVKSGTMGMNVFVLPVGFRPAIRFMVAQVEGTNSIGRLDMWPDGGIVPVIGNNGYFSITTSFPVDV
jgi:hypothetical protein